ncbi:MAG TPA: NAD(P)/FAD-dependent oxidoreductase, partial [Candidatus Elarobacter sp.]|nr:NAD(P)/FAD-dependent oxidoreductase [Candidatus Elarobacter sp.]
VGVAPQSDRKPVDVAIVGGGVSGLYSAWRLKENDPEKNVVVYERDYRTGGRLLSAVPPGMDDLRAELGGMRFLSNQSMVSALAQNVFRLDVRPFPVSEGRNIAYLRGHRLRRSQLTDPNAVPYNLREDERGKSVGQLMLDAFAKIVPGSSQFTAADWKRDMRTRTFQGRPLYEQGFWNVLFRVMSAEAYAFVVDSSGYDTTVSNWNAADAIPWFLADFGTDVEYRYPREGMQAIPDRIREKFETGLHGRVVENATVTRVAKGNKGKIALTFGDGSIVEASQVILAMPRRSLELIDLRGAFESEYDRVRGLIESVTPQPLFKLFSCYARPWWNELGIVQGQTTTDIPIRQTYYFGTAGQRPGGDASNTNSLLMSTYDDGRNIKYWIGFLRDGAPVPYSEDAGSVEWRRNPAPKEMVDEVHRLVAEVHGVALDAIPKPYAAAYHDWSIDPFGGGYNLWKIHARSWEVSENIVQPVNGLPVYVCGEAYSHDQGWVEGALETAEDMLTRKFGLRPPAWLGSAPASGVSGQVTSSSAMLRTDG